MLRLKFIRQLHLRHRYPPPPPPPPLPPSLQKYIQPLVKLKTM